MSIFSRVIDFVFGGAISAEGKPRVNLSVRAVDDFRDRTWGSGDKYPRERRAYDRDEVLLDVIESWRENPLTRHIVALTTDFVVGSGVSVESPDQAANEFLQMWWEDDLNRMLIRCYEWCDELTRSGELFPVLSTDLGGMTYVRAYPASQISEIKHIENDLEQETFYTQKPEDKNLEERFWRAYDHRTDARDESGKFADVMLHFAINKPVGAVRGESDLSAVVRWVNRYAAWLEDRVRLNRFRQSFLYVVYGQFKSAAERLARQAELNAQPPNPGSILVADMDQEKWEVIHPKLDSFEAGTDGLAVKKFIAVGAGVPLHFLAEPESATRTTAEQSDDPSHRHYERRQILFRWFLGRVARVALRRRAMVDTRLDPQAEIIVKAPDIFARDNVQLATAARAIVEAFAGLHDRGLITPDELLRLSYRFAGELVDVKQILADAKKSVGAAVSPTASAPTPQSVTPPPNGKT